MRRAVYIVIHRIGTAGKTAAVMDQCSMFLSLGYSPTILTLNYDPTLASTVRRLRAESGISDDVAIRNVHDDLRRASTIDPSADWSRHEDRRVDDLLAQDDELSTKGYVRYFDERGTYIKFQRFSSSGSLVQTTYFENRRAVVRREYDDAGFCGKEIRYDIRTGNRNEERYYTPDGFCYAHAWFDPESGGLQGVYQNDRTSRSSRKYRDNVQWHNEWLRTICSESSVKPILIAESPSTVHKVTLLPEDTADPIYVFHESHLDAPYRRGARTRPEYDASFRKFAQMSSVVVMTDQQAQDIRDTYGDYRNLHVVPNLVRDKRSGEPVETVPGRIGVFSRLVEEKRIDHLIGQLGTIRQSIPTAHLEVFGQGPARPDLERLAAESGVKEHVRFHGRIGDVGDEMARCAVTVSTSLRESFGLSVAESLAVGTPVVAYDICYGPRDLIRHGHDGYLVASGDAKRLGEAISEVLEDPEAAGEMGRRGAERMKERFGRDAVAAQWEKLLEEAGRHTPVLVREPDLKVGTEQPAEPTAQPTGATTATSASGVVAARVVRRALRLAPRPVRSRLLSIARRVRRSTSR